MHAAILREFGSWPVPTRLASPQPASGEALLRVRAVGLCGTDLKVVGGAMKLDLALPAVIGHEISGEVVVAPDDGPQPGTRVACHPFLACGDCAACAAGRTNLCRRLQSVGLDRQGGLAEYVAVPATSLIRFSAGTTFATAAVTMDAVATSWHALRGQGRLTAGERVVVVGAGGLGMNAVQIAAGAGAAVAVIDRNPARRDRALVSGAEVAVGFDAVADLGDWLSGGADVVLEATGSRAGFDAAVGVLGAAGRLVCCGHQPGVEVGLESTGMVGREVSVIGSRGSTLVDATAALAAVERGEVRPHIDSVYDLAHVGDGFERVASRQALGRVVIEI
jgi:propanol-preferring alcohol dehydrogenase